MPRLAFRFYRSLIVAAILALLATQVAASPYQIDCGNVGDPESDCDEGVGANPINPHKANVTRKVVDLEVFGPAPIEFSRIYQSRTTSFNTPYWDYGRRQTWQHNWNYEMRQLGSKTHDFFDIKVRYPDGRDHNFRAADATGDVLVPPARNGDRLYRWSGGTVGYTLVTAEGREYDFQRIPSPRFRLLEVRDGRGLWWNLTHNGDGQIVRITNAFGDWLELERETAGDYSVLTRIHTSDGREVTYNYVAWEPLETIVLGSVDYPGNATAHYGWVGSDSPTEGRPLLASARDPRYPGAGARIRYEYNYGAEFELPNENGFYNVSGTVKSERNYDTNALIVELSLGGGSDAPILGGDGVEVRRKFAEGRLVESVDGEGNVTTHTYSQDGHGYRISTTDPLGKITLYGRDYAGRITSVTDPIGHTVERSYNAAGFVVSETDPLNCKHFF